MTCFRLKSGVPLHSICTLKGISYHSALGRIEKGDTPDEALMYAKEKSGKGCALNNCQHYLSTGESLRSVCIRKGVCHTSCYLLVRKGLSPDEALATLLNNMRLRAEASKEKESKGIPQELCMDGYGLLKALYESGKPMYATEVARLVRTTRRACWCHNYFNYLEKLGYIKTSLHYKGKLPKRFVVITDKGRAVFNPKKDS